MDEGLSVPAPAAKRVAADETVKIIINIIFFIEGFQQFIAMIFSLLRASVTWVPSAMGASPSW